MRKITKTPDHDGHVLRKGDTVTTLSDNLSGKICELAGEDGESFVRVRPIFQSYGKGIWHAASHVRWLSSPKPKKVKSN